MGKKTTAIPISLVIIIAFTLLQNSSFSETIPHNELIVPLTNLNDKVLTAELVHIPLLIYNVKLDISLKANTYLNIYCELRIGEHYFRYNFNDLSFEYHIDAEQIQLDGKVSEYGAMSFKATVDTDGFIEGTPNLVLFYMV